MAGYFLDRPRCCQFNRGLAGAADVFFLVQSLCFLFLEGGGRMWPLSIARPNNADFVLWLLRVPSFFLSTSKTLSLCSGPEFGQVFFRLFGGLLKCFSFFFSLLVGWFKKPCLRVIMDIPPPSCPASLSFLVNTLTQIHGMWIIGAF